MADGVGAPQHDLHDALRELVEGASCPDGPVAIADLLAAGLVLADPGSTLGPDEREALEPARGRIAMTATCQAPRSSLVRFWLAYIPWIELGEPMDAAAAHEAWTDGHDDAAAYLVATGEVARDDPRVRALVERCGAAETLREVYLREVLGGPGGRPE